MVLIRNAQRAGDFSVMAGKGKPAPAEPPRVLVSPKRAERQTASGLLLDEIKALLVARKLLRSRFETLCKMPQLISFLEDGRAMQPETEARVRAVMANLRTGAIA